MAEQEGITVQVSVGAKKDVSKGVKHSSKSVLFLNKKGHAHMLPEDLALNNEKNHKGYIIHKDQPEYISLYKMAIGYDDKIGTERFFQKAGKVYSIDDSATFNVKTAIEKETTEVVKTQKEGRGK